MPEPRPISQISPQPEIEALAIGVFDGVHLGHQAVIRSAVEHCHLPKQAGVLTFEPHPLQVIAPAKAPPRLTTNHQRNNCLRLYGIQNICVLHFDESLRQLSAADFVLELKRIYPNLKHIVIGIGWAFGQNRQGGASFLRLQGQQHGFEVTEVPFVEWDGSPVSSTRIRSLISQMNFAEAKNLLGRSYAVEGTVCAGDGRGRSLGFPTANLSSVNQLLPPYGVYACRTRVDGNTFRSVMNWGNRPTIQGSSPSLEVHLIDFSGNLYGKTIEIFDFSFLRTEQKFPDLDSLRRQINDDIQAALKKID